MFEYFCVGAHITEDLWISGFRPVATTGTYTMLLTASDFPQPEGPFQCDASGFGPQLLFTAGARTGDLVFPAGTAMRVEAGKYLRLHVLAFNDGATELEGDSGIHIQTVPADDVTQQAEAFFTGRSTTSAAFRPPGNRTRSRHSARSPRAGT